MWFTIIYFVGVIIIYKVYDYFKWKRIAKDILGEELLKQIDKKGQRKLTRPGGQSFCTKTCKQFCATFPLDFFPLM